MFGTKHSKTNRLQMTIEYKTNEQNRMQNMKIYWNIQIEIYNHIRLVLAVFAALPSLHSRDTLVIRGIKRKIRTKHGIILPVCFQFSLWIVWMESKSIPLWHWKSTQRWLQKPWFTYLCEANFMESLSGSIR